MCCDIWVCGHPPPQLSCGSLSYEGEEAPQRSHPVRGSVRALKRAPREAPRVWSDLDRSTVWAETAVSSRFLHMVLTRDIDAADAAIRCGCHLSNSSVKATVRSHFASPPSTLVSTDTPSTPPRHSVDTVDTVDTSTHQGSRSSTWTRTAGTRARCRGRRGAAALGFWKTSHGRRGAHRGGRGLSKGRRDFRDRHAGLLPVSYTHLTLPTILLV